MTNTANTPIEALEQIYPFAWKPTRCDRKVGVKANTAAVTAWYEPMFLIERHKLPCFLPVGNRALTV